MNGRFVTESNVCCKVERSGGEYLVETPLTMTPYDFFKKMLAEGHVADILAHTNNKADHKEAIRKRDEAYAKLAEARTHVKYMDTMQAEQFAKDVLEKVAKEQEIALAAAKNRAREAEIDRIVNERLAVKMKENPERGAQSNTAT